MATTKQKDLKSTKKILISACLVGDRCRYDGSSCFDEQAFELVQKGLAIKCCPEILAGLPIPRSPLEIVDGDGYSVLDATACVVDKAGIDYTEAFIKGANKTLQLCKQHGIKKAILKIKSPSCGYGQIYDGDFCGRLKTGVGVTAALLERNGIDIEGM